MLYLPLRFGVCGAVVPLYPEAFVVLSLCSRPCPVTLCDLWPCAIPDAQAPPILSVVVPHDKLASLGSHRAIVYIASYNLNPYNFKINTQTHTH